MKNPEQLLRTLNPEQIQAVTNLRGPLLITAGAGTGKTTTIAHRIAYGVSTGAYNPSKILALSYTARAAAELRDRLHVLNVPAVTVRTFHSAALAQLQYFWPIHTGAKLPTLEPNKSKLLSEVAKQLGFKLDDRQLREVISEIEWRKYRLLSLDEYGLLNDRPAVDGLSSDQIFKVIEGYEQQKITKSVIDWEDVLILNLGLLQAEPAALSHVHSQYRQFFVDEFQDISPLQWELLLAWLGKSTDICAVGDSRQAIFGFAGADVSILQEMALRFENLNQVELSVNYRSSRQILEVAKRIDPESNLLSGRSNRKSPGAQQFVRLSTASVEANWISTRVMELIESGTPASEIAVLSRITNQLEPVFQALQAGGAPVVVRGVSYFQQPKVVSAVSLIRALQVTNSVDPTFIQVQQVLRQLGWRPERPGAFDEDWERLDWLMQRLNSMPEEATLAEFAVDLEELQRGQYEPKLPAVTLSTIHVAKGLEWEVVFVNQLAEGSLPYYRAAGDPERLAEEKRLLYVAITRAKSHIYGSYSTSDSSGRRVQKSRFMETIDFENID